MTCLLCGKPTEFCCSDCAISFAEKAAVCSSSACRDAHEQACEERHRQAGYVVTRLGPGAKSIRRVADGQ